MFRNQECVPERQTRIIGNSDMVMKKRDHQDKQEVNIEKYHMISQ